jgi:hypothetical protein
MQRSRLKWRTDIQCSYTTIPTLIFFLCNNLGLLLDVFQLMILTTNAALLSRNALLRG